MPLQPYRIVLADDHDMVRQGLKKMLGAKGDIEVVGEAGDGLELLNLLRVSGSILHLAIVDISMPNLGGIEATRQIKMMCPDVKVLILTIHKREEYLDHALAAGADGYLLKEDANEELFPAIEAIRKGEVFISSHLGQGKRQ